MPISDDVARTTYQDLRGPLENAFTRSTELWRHLERRAAIDMNSGTYIERTMTGAAPARGVGLFVGTEPLNMTRYQNINVYRVEPHRIAVAINIPGKDLDINDGEKGAVKLMEEYPVSVMDGVICDINSYLLTGASRGLVFATAELAGFLTLNGQFSSGIGTGVTNGVLDFSTPATQTDTVQNVAKTSTGYHFNQYGLVGGWATNGMSTMKRVYRQCAHYSGKPDSGGPDLIIMDDDTFANFEEAKAANVRVSFAEDKQEKTKAGIELSLYGAKVVSSLDLDRTLSVFSGDAANGVAYLLDTRWWELCFLLKPTLSDFSERVGTQDALTSLFRAHFNTICKRPVAQGAVAGGAV
ncbi:MAG: hypothetical protein QME96_05575 [Myxococcota bacterium]|nr:hypothetical protein [Myxococcota bacterium]